MASASKSRRVLASAQVIARWPDYDPEQRRAVVEALLEKIVVSPLHKGRPRFDPTRLAITWR